MQVKDLTYVKEYLHFIRINNEIYYLLDDYEPEKDGIYAIRAVKASDVVEDEEGFAYSHIYTIVIKRTSDPDENNASYVYEDILSIERTVEEQSFEIY